MNNYKVRWSEQRNKQWQYQCPEIEDQYREFMADVAQQDDDLRNDIAECEKKNKIFFETGLYVEDEDYGSGSDYGAEDDQKKPAAGDGDKKDGGDEDKKSGDENNDDDDNKSAE